MNAIFVLGPRMLLPQCIPWAFQDRRILPLGVCAKLMNLTDLRATIFAGKLESSSWRCSSRALEDFLVILLLVRD